VNDELCGVIEIASFQKLEPFQIEFVENVAENIASSITNIKISLRTSRLLKESQEQSDALVSKEEQLRQNMEELQAAQEEANRQAEKFVNFTNSVNHTMIRAEFMPDGSLIYANTRFLNKLGYMNNSDVEGKNISMFINDKDKAWFFNIWDDLSKGGKHFEGDMKFVTRQRQDLWTMATFTCIRRSDNSVERILFLAIDTTDQKKQSLDYEGQIDALNRSTIKAEFTPEGEFLGGNQNFLKTLEYSQEQANEKTVFDFISVLEVNKFKKSWESVVNGEAFQGQFQINTSSNAHKWFNGTYSAVRNMYNEVAKIVFIGYDATKEKLMEIETAAQTEQLKLQEEQLRSAQEDLSKKLEKARYEMQLQYKEVEKVKIRNERTLEG
ncbi:MAG: PAS domain-containing protein, partial [Bacteroidota bacterium]|nr:PAS domain-containing protein [Bacteroidota bacterium]